MSATSKIMCAIHGMLLHYKFDKKRWAYKVSPSEWDQIYLETTRGQLARNFLTGTGQLWTLDKLTLLGVDLIRDESLASPSLLKDYGSSG